MRNTGIEYPERGKIRFCDLGAPPDPEPTQVLIETVYSGVTNGTERHALLGEHGWAGAFPSAHGYQHVGRIAKTGAAVDEFNEGDWVFFGQYVGHKGWNLVDVASANARSNASHLVFRLPDEFDHKLCALMGVAGVALRGIRRFRIAPAQKVWVAGQGPIGHFAAQAARAFGSHVTVSDIHPGRLEIARQCGAHRVIDASADDHWKQLESGAPYNCIIDCCNLDSFLHDLSAHNSPDHGGILSHGGVIGILAVHSDTTFNWSLLHMLEASIEVSCHFSLDDLNVLLHFMQQDIIRIGPVITHFEKIDHAIGIYETLRDTPGDLLGVVFDWGS